MGKEAHVRLKTTPVKHNSVFFKPIKDAAKFYADKQQNIPIYLFDALLELLKQYGAYDYKITNHISVDQIEKQTCHWVRRFNLADGLSIPHEKFYERHAKIKCGAFAYQTYAYASQEIIQLGADLISWLFLFDDIHAEGRGCKNIDELHDKLNTYRSLLVTLNMPTDASPFHYALKDIALRGEAISNPHWRKQFSKSMNTYFDGCIDEFQFRRKGIAPTIETYLKLRAKSIGAYPVFDLILLDTDFQAYFTETHAEDLNNKLEKCRFYASLLCALTNDIFSLEKELEEGESNNSVIILNKQKKLGNLNKAAMAATELNLSFLNFFRDIILKLKENSTPCYLLEYVSRLRTWAIGNLYWTFTSGRYNCLLKYPELKNYLEIIMSGNCQVVVSPKITMFSQDKNSLNLKAKL